MQFSKDETRICYEWFLKNGITKGKALSDRTVWDGLQNLLAAEGFNRLHDDVKLLIERTDKSGYLGGISAGVSFAEQDAIVTKRKENTKETGDIDGMEGVAKRIDAYASAMSNELGEYERTVWWTKRSREYRESVGWMCELCMKQHPSNSRELVTHHKVYKVNGELVFNHESDEILLAVCSKQCHQLADIARYLRVGRLTQSEVDEAVQTLFAGIR